MMAFKSKRKLENIHTMKQRIKINCNSGVMNIIQQRDYVGVMVWDILKVKGEGIAIILSMNELEKKYRITYDRWDEYYIVHTTSGEARFYKDENGLLYIDAAVLLSQTRSEQAGVAFEAIMRASVEAKFWKSRKHKRNWG